jgi:hypothetical protein
MAWTTPRTWVAGEVVTAALLNIHLRDNLNAVSGIWGNYTPTVSGWTIGNGTLSGRYTQIGKTVHAIAVLVAGTTTNPLGVPVLSLPVTPAAGPSGAASGISVTYWYDTSAAITYSGHGRITTSGVSVYRAGVTNGQLDGTHPFVLASTDFIEAHVTYQAA